MLKQETGGPAPAQGDCCNCLGFALASFWVSFGAPNVMPERKDNFRTAMFSRFYTNSAAGIRRTTEYDTRLGSSVGPRHSAVSFRNCAGIARGIVSSQYKPTHEAHFDFDSPAETSQLLSTSRVRAVPAQAAQLFSTRVVQE